MKMLKKIKQWLYDRRCKAQLAKEMSELMGTSDQQTPTELYTREQVEKVYNIGYNDGKNDGLAIAREQATKSLKEILQWKNQKKPM